MYLLVLLYTHVVNIPRSLCKVKINNMIRNILKIKNKRLLKKLLYIYLYGTYSKYWYFLLEDTNISYYNLDRICAIAKRTGMRKYFHEVSPDANKYIETAPPKCTITDDSFSYNILDRDGIFLYTLYENGFKRTRITTSDFIIPKKRLRSKFAGFNVRGHFFIS